MNGVDLIAEERKRQAGKGFGACHDDYHDDGSILTAAGRIIYDLEGGTHESDPEDEVDPDATWPERLSAHVVKKYGDDRIRRLTIAGALIAAEIERLQRV